MRNDSSDAEARRGDGMREEPKSLFEGLRTGAFPFDGLTDYDVRVALLAAHGILDDHGLVEEFAQAAEEGIVEARGQAMEP